MPTKQIVSLEKRELTDKVIAEKHGIERSKHWPEAEKAFRAQHPHCQSCPETGHLNVHHKYPFHYVVGCERPDLELDPRNLMTLCVDPDQEHHLLLGHLDDFESFNPNVEVFAQTYAGKSAAQIKSDAAWQLAHAGKPKHLDKMNAAEKAEFKRHLDKVFPPDPKYVALAKSGR